MKMKRCHGELLRQPLDQDGGFLLWSHVHLLGNEWVMEPPAFFDQYFAGLDLYNVRFDFMYWIPWEVATLEELSCLGKGFCLCEGFGWWCLASLLGPFLLLLPVGALFVLVERRRRSLVIPINIPAGYRLWRTLRDALSHSRSIS